MNKFIKSFLCFSLIFILIMASGCKKKPVVPTPEPPVPEPPVETMTVNDYTKELNKNVYTTNALTGKYGLSEDKNVGVNQSTTLKNMYEMPADSVFEKEDIIEFETISEGSDSQKLDAAIHAAKLANTTGKKAKINLPDRQIDLVYNELTHKNQSYTIVLDSFQGLYIQGGKNTLLMIDNKSSWKGGIAITNCSDIHFEGVRIDYLIPPTLTGIVESADETSMTIDMSIPQSMYDTVLAYKQTPALMKTLYSMIQYDKFTNAPSENGIVLTHDNDFFESFDIATTEASGKITAATISVKLKEGYKSSFRAPRIGEKFALGFTMYGNSGISIGNSENVYFEDCAIYTCPGMALTISKCNNIYMNRVNFELKGDRLMTATADGFHINACTGDIKITNCLIENTHDDALNIKSGYYYTLGSQDSVARTFVITKKTEGINKPKIGDTIEIYNSNTFELKGKFTITEVSGSVSSYTLTVKERISGTVDWANCVVTNVSDLAKFTFSNNIIRNKRNRGILVQVRGALIENNTFMNVGHGAISIHSSLDQYNEATVPQDIIIRNNKLINNGYLLSLLGDISIFAIANGGKVAPSGTITGIEIYNNYITDSGNAGMYLRGVGKKDSFIKNNLFYNVARVSASELSECCIGLDNVNDITIEGNYNYYTLDSTTFSGIVPLGLTKTSTITLKDNNNLKYQEINGVVSNTNVPKTEKGTITIDGNLQEWGKIGTSILMDGSSLATGDVIDYDTYKDVFDIKTCKMTWTDDGIYFAFDVKDNKLDFKKPVNFWNGDCVEIFLSDILDSKNADFQLYKDDGNVLQMAFSPDWEPQFTLGADRTNKTIVANKNEFKVKVVTTADGYAGEAYLPFTVLSGLKQKILSGSSIAMAFVFADNDRDTISRKRVQVGNVPHFVEAYKTKTAKMPLFTFI